MIQAILELEILAGYLVLVSCLAFIICSCMKNGFRVFIYKMENAGIIWEEATGEYTIKNT